MVICLERGADLRIAQLMPLPLTVCCFSKIQIGFTFLVPAHPGSPGQRAVKRVCVCARLSAYLQNLTSKLPRETFLRVAYVRDSVLLWLRCDTLSTSGFTDDVTFAHNGHQE